MKGHGLFGNIKELTDEEYIEEYYLQGYNGSTLTTYDHNLIRYLFKELYDELVDELKYLFLKGDFELLQRLIIILRTEKENLKGVKASNEFMLELFDNDIDDEEEENFNRIKTLVYVYETKIDYINQLIELIDSYTNTPTDDTKIELDASNAKRDLSEYNNVKPSSTNQMNQISEFINEVYSIDVSLEKRYLVENMSPLKEEDVPKEAKKHLKSKELYVVNKCSEGTIRTLYNNARLSLASLSDKELENTLKLLKDYGYEHFDKAYRTYYMKLTNGEAHPKHDTYFMLALESRFKNDVPHFGVFTMEFLHDLMDDVGIKRGYLFSLTQDVKKMMGKNDKKITPQSTTAVSSLQSEPHSPHPKASSSIENNVEPINNITMDINFEAIFEVALNYADDPEEMKEFCMREQRKAEKEHEYIDKSFYKGLLKVVADKKERAKYQPKPGPTPTHIGSFFIAGGGGNRYDYNNIELLEQMINEICKEDEFSQKDKPHQIEDNKYAHYTALQWGAIIYYANTEKLLPKSTRVDDMLSAFKDKHNIKLADSTLKVRYYEAARKITVEFNYPADDLEDTIPFFLEHYNKLADKIKNEVKYIREENEQENYM